MNDINSLKEIGLNEVARKTHIEAEYLGYILNKNYEKLSRLNVKGFLKILEREYNVDYKEWLEEYNTFLNEHKDELPRRTTTVSPKISAYSSSDKGSSGLLLVIVIIVAISFLIWFFEGYKHFLNLFEDKNRSISYTNTAIVEHAKKNINSIKDTNITINLPVPTPQLQTTISEQPERITQNIDLNVVQINTETSNEENIQVAQEAPVSTDGANDKNDTTVATAPIEQNRSTTVGSEYSTVGLSEVKIIPRKKVWIGVIDLENNKKRSVDTGNAFSLNLDIKQLVVTGHGDVNLEISGDVIKFDTSNPKRFLVEKDKITLISYDEFVSLNKGKSW